MSEMTPPPEDELPDTSAGELLPAGPEELRPQDPTEEGLPDDEQGGDQTSSPDGGSS